MSKMLYAGTVKGVVAARSENDEPWQIQGGALNSWMVTAVAVDPMNPRCVFAGTRGDGVWLSEDSGQTWNKPCYGKPGPGKVQCLTIAPDDPNTIYAGGEPIGIWRSKDAGKNWTSLESVWKVPAVKDISYPVATVEPHVRDIAFDQRNPNTMYAALQVGSLLKSTDRGATWTLIEDGIDADVHTVVPGRGGSGRVYAATGGHDNRLGKASGRALYLSDDEGTSWMPIAMEFNQEYSVPLTIDPNDESILYSAVASGPPPFWKRPSGAETTLIRSQDGGKTWESIETGFPELKTDFVSAIVADPASVGRIYISSNKGAVYTSPDRGNTWEKLDLQLPDICDMKVVTI